MSVSAVKASVDPERISRLTASIEADIDAGRYHGAAIAVAHHGEVVLREAFGAGEQATGRPMQIDSVFRVLSVTKIMTNVLVLSAIERGLLAFNTRVIDVIPEFLGRDRFRAARKDRVTVAHLLSHRAGLPPTPEPLPYGRLGKLADVIAAICEIDAVSVPGEELVYSPAINHALLGEMVRRVNGDATFRECLQRELLDPLGMSETALGLPGRLADRIVPIKACFGDEGWLTAADLEILNEVISGDAEMPWVGAVSTVDDLLRIAEMLRRGGELDGVRILSPAIIDKATVCQTGDQPNDLFRRIALAEGWEVGPGNLGLGFPLSGSGVTHSVFGTLTSPRTFGAFGAGSTLLWVDPVRDMSLVCLTTGVMAEPASIVRFQRISDMAIASATD